MPHEPPASPSKGESQTKAVVKKLSPSELTQFLKDCVMADCDPRLVLDRFGTALQEARQAEGTIKQKEKQLAEANELMNKAAGLVALDTHYLMSETVGERFRTFAIELANRLTEEYDCKTPSEKALAESAAGSYARTIQLTREFNSAFSMEFLSGEKNAYYAMIAKELDRTHRRFAAALLALKQLKAPALEVSIKAKTAFVAQNQQVNVPPLPSSSSSTPEYATVEPT